MIPSIVLRPLVGALLAFRKTISVNEEYSVVMSLQLKPGGQQLLASPMVDKIRARPVNGGDPVELYFSPEWHFIRLQHSLSAPKS
jgi:hypothetical protein